MNSLLKRFVLSIPFRLLSKWLFFGSLGAHEISIRRCFLNRHTFAIIKNTIQSVFLNWHTSCDRQINIFHFQKVLIKPFKEGNQYCQFEISEIQKLAGSPRSGFARREVVRDGQTSSHRPRLVVSRSTCPPLPPPPPREQLCNRYCSNEHTHRGERLLLIGTSFTQSHSSPRSLVHDGQTRLAHATQASAGRPHVVC